MNPETTLAKLLEAWQDGGLTKAEEAELLLLLDSDAVLRRRFAEQVHLIGAVRASAEQHPRWLSLFDLLGHDEHAANVTPFDVATMERISLTPVRTWYKLPVVRAMAAVLALLLVASFFMKSRGTGKTVVAAADPPGSFVAVVVATSEQDGQPSGTYLKSGEISQATGWLTLQTLNGVSVTLDAPFRAELIDQ